MKRNKRQRNYKTTTSTELDYMRVIKISIGVLLVFAIVLVVSKIAMGEISFGKKDKDKEETNIVDYQEILAGETFNRKRDNYYVFFYSFTDDNASYYQSLINSYKTKDSSAVFYTVDLDKKLNKQYLVSDDDEINPRDIDSLEVKNPTILKISDSKAVDVIAGKDDINSFFGN